MKANESVHRTFRLRRSDVERLDRYSIRMGISRSELMRRFITALPPLNKRREHVRVKVR